MTGGAARGRARWAEPRSSRDELAEPRPHASQAGTVFTAGNGSGHLSSGTAPTPARPCRHRRHSVTVRGAAFLGIGAMVGAGIFALLGEAGAVAGSAVWISFLLAGIVAALLGYTVVKLGVRYPSSGGLIAYLMQGFGNGRLVGIASWLGYFAAIVIVGSMVAVAFGAYATSLFVGEDAAGWWDNAFASAVVVAMAAINLVGSRVVDRAQSLIVVVLLAVFAVFIAVTIVDIDLDLLALSGYPSVSDIIASVALTFFAYLGFSVITFAVGDLRDPARELPKAMYVALGVTSVLYVLISLGVFGTLTVAEVVGYGETAIAEAARPALGDAGFTMVSIAALLATASSVNATLYASGGLTRMLAGAGQFPPLFARETRFGPHAGMLITAAIMLVISNLVDLSAIASVGSACSLVIFLLVGVSAFRLRAETGSLAIIVLTAIATTAVVLVFFAVDILRNAPETFAAIVGVTALSVVLDLVWKRVRGPLPPAAARARRPSRARTTRRGRACGHRRRVAAHGRKRGKLVRGLARRPTVERRVRAPVDGDREPSAAVARPPPPLARGRDGLGRPSSPSPTPGQGDVERRQDRPCPRRGPCRRRSRHGASPRSRSRTTAPAHRADRGEPSCSANVAVMLRPPIAIALALLDLDDMAELPPPQELPDAARAHDGQLAP